MTARLFVLATGAALLMGCASTSMKGVVKDRDTGAPVPGAMVQVEERTALTDTRGYYGFDELEPQDFYRVTVAAPNYHAVSESIAPRDGDDQDRIVHDFMLVEQPPRLAERTTIEVEEGAAAQAGQQRTTMEAGAQRGERKPQNVTVSSNEEGETDVDLSGDEDTPTIKIRIRDKAE